MIRRLALVLVALVTLTACAGQPHAPLVYSGKTLATMGHTFADMVALANQLLDQKVITPEQYAPVKEFGTRFQTVYPALKKAWETARANYLAALSSQDPDAALQAFTKEQQTAVALETLSQELGNMVKLVHQLATGKKSWWPFSALPFPIPA